MKRKIFVFILLACVCFTFAGCGKTTKDFVLENMSELTKTYYFAEDENLSVSISSGERETDYAMDGRSSKKTHFALVGVKFSSNQNLQEISAKIDIESEKLTKILEFNPLNSTFMCDLERFVANGKEVSIEIDEKTLKLADLSQDFGTNWDQAIEIAIKNLRPEIEKERKFANLGAECYLKIMDKKVNNFDDFFWCFTVVNIKNENFSIVISTVDGSVLAKSK